MSSILLRREDTQNSNSLTSLLITLVVLVVFGMVLSGSLYILHRYRKAKREAGLLPSYEDSTKNRNHLSIQTNRQSTYILEKQNLIDNSSPMPLSPENVPEIRITFPEEEDKDGRRLSGRVMVVQVGEAGVGFIKPIDTLPPYHQDQQQGRYVSLDLEQIGGLKEVR